MPSPGAPTAALALVSVLLLAGCAGAASREAVGPGEAPPGTGTLQGVVVDDTILPLENATVLVIELGLTSNTTDAGDFAFVGLDPGLYTIVASKEGYRESAQNVPIEADETSRATLALERLPSTKAYHETRTLNTLFCNVTIAIVSVIGCDAQSPTRFNLTFPQNWAQILDELDWKPEGLSTHPLLSLSLRFIESTPGGAVGIIHEYNRTEGPSPLRLLLEPSTKYRNEQTPPAGQPGNLEAAIGQPRWKPNGVDSQFGLVRDQRVTLYHTVFYYAPDPGIATFSALVDR